MKRTLAIGWTFVVIIALLLGQLTLPATVLAADGDSDVAVTLAQCRDQLLADFNVADLRKDNRPMPHMAKQFAKIIDEIIDKRGTRDFEKSKERFDRARGNLLEKIIDGRWGMNETSDDILSDCFFAVHPDADVES